MTKNWDDQGMGCPVGSSSVELKKRERSSMDKVEERAVGNAGARPDEVRFQRQPLAAPQQNEGDDSGGVDQGVMVFGTAKGFATSGVGMLSRVDVDVERTLDFLGEWGVSETDWVAYALRCSYDGQPVTILGFAHAALDTAGRSGLCGVVAAYHDDDLPGLSEGSLNNVLNASLSERDSQRNCPRPANIDRFGLERKYPAAMTTTMKMRDSRFTKIRIPRLKIPNSHILTILAGSIYIEDKSFPASQKSFVITNSECEGVRPFSSSDLRSWAADISNASHRMATRLEQELHLVRREMGDLDDRLQQSAKVKIKQLQAEIETVKRDLRSEQTIVKDHGIALEKQIESAIDYLSTDSRSKQRKAMKSAPRILEAAEQFVRQSRKRVNSLIGSSVKTARGSQTTKVPNNRPRAGKTREAGAGASPIGGPYDYPGRATEKSGQHSKHGRFDHLSHRTADRIIWFISLGLTALLLLIFGLMVNSDLQDRLKEFPGDAPVDMPNTGDDQGGKIEQ